MRNCCNLFVRGTPFAIGPMAASVATAIVITSLWAASRLRAAEAAAIGTPATVDQIIARMRTVDDAFDPKKGSFRVHCRQEIVFYNESGQVDNDLGGSTEVDYARKGASLYVHYINSLANLPAPEDETITWKDGICMQRSVDMLGIHPVLLPQALEYFRYTNQIFADAYRGIEWTSETIRRSKLTKSPSEECFYLLPRMLIENRSKYKLRPRLEGIDGRNCQVLEWSGHDVIWVDAEHGGLVLKRELSEASDRPVFTWRNFDVREVRSGLWLPMSQEEVRYRHGTDPEALLGTVRRKSRTALIDISFEDLPESLFTLPVDNDERLLVLDSVRRITYTRHPSGTDPVMNALAEASARVVPQMRSNWWLFNGAVLGGVCVVFLRVAAQRRVGASK